MASVHMKLRQRSIVVGLLLDGEEEDFVQSCASLALQLDCPLELVHVLEHTAHAPATSELGINPFFAYERALNEMDEALARKSLETIRLTLPRALPARTHILRGYPSAALCSFAAECKAGLIVCGIRAPGKASASLFSGLSNICALASNAETPLLLLSRRGTFDWGRRLKLMIGDDLEIEGRFALENALRLAEDLHSPSLIHVHVHERDRSEIAAMLQSVQAELERSHAQAPQQLDPKIYIDLLTQRIQGDLIYRFHNSEGAQNLAASYEPRVYFGDTARELERCIEETGARVLVFGRHHLIHRRGFSLGKLPYPTMIKDSVATFIVPDRGFPRISP